MFPVFRRKPAPSAPATEAPGLAIEPAPPGGEPTGAPLPGTTRRAPSSRLARPKPLPELRRRWRGCLIGGAVGDALGAPVEFKSLEEIRAELGEGGVHGFLEAYGRFGSITDDTQLSMFTAEGLLRAYTHAAMHGTADIAAIVDHAYLRWLHTQGATSAVAPVLDGWLVRVKELHASRVPGATIVQSLERKTAFGERPRNHSKGCGGAMRVAPVGLYCARLHEGVSDERLAKQALDLGVDTTALTHGHPTGQLAAGFVAALIALLARGRTLPASLDLAASLLARRPGHAETLAAVSTARRLAETEPASAGALARLGEGWAAEEAVAIAVYCALSATDFDTGVRLAVNHDGDSDSTGAIAGNLLGTLLGIEGVPTRFTNSLELVDALAALADDLATFPTWPVGEFQPASDLSEHWLERYPGH